MRTEVLMRPMLSVTFQVHGDYKEDVGVKLDRPADGDEVIPGAEEVAAAE